MKIVIKCEIVLNLIIYVHKCILYYVQEYFIVYKYNSLHNKVTEKI